MGLTTAKPFCRLLPECSSMPPCCCIWECSFSIPRLYAVVQLNGCIVSVSGSYINHLGILLQGIGTVMCAVHGIRGFLVVRFASTT